MIAALHRPPHPKVTWAAPEQWMVKLRPLGTVSERLVPELADALEAELSGAGTALCAFGPATKRHWGQWLGLPVTGLDELAEVVFAATAGIVPVTHPQPFEAYLIIARGHVPKELAGEPIEGEWAARTIELVADRSAPGRPRFENLASFSLDT
ncbi:hypothetical protein [Lentzea sp. NBRC 105346]|uniref:2'-5' RNA ligase family protein n=1 Tax=Lentzea sp. NBRC 105346 TaxID=3032205 RepID=UPI0025560DA5|nr:hypothetical protein [Lentzea sp. NBRC 105346]